MQIVAAMNFGATRYVSRTHKLPFRQEIVAELEDIVYSLLQEFYGVSLHCCGRFIGSLLPLQLNGHIKPQRIIVYRDGVSEGQYAEVCSVVMHFEVFLNSIKSTCHIV